MDNKAIRRNLTQLFPSKLMTILTTMSNSADKFLAKHFFLHIAISDGVANSTEPETSDHLDDLRCAYKESLGMDAN